MCFCVLFSEIPYLKGDGIELKKITKEDLYGLKELVSSEKVYEYEPAFLFERKYADISLCIDRLYDECLKESLILGIYENGEFCGLAEFYGYRASIKKISIGYRLLERCWGRGIATKALKLMTDYLYSETDIEIITASTLPENIASAKVLRKNGFELVVHGSDEDWGYESPLPTDKWIR